MAIRWQRTRPHEQAFAMAPMVDMVFLLLVFFMCVTAASGGRARLQVDLPQTHAAGAAGGQGNRQAASAQIVLSVGADGELSLNGRLCEPSQLPSLLRRLAAEQGAGASVRIRADAGVPYRQIEPLLQACSAAGISKVSYAAHEAMLMRALPPQSTPNSEGSRTLQNRWGSSGGDGGDRSTRNGGGSSKSGGDSRRNGGDSSNAPDAAAFGNGGGR